MVDTAQLAVLNTALAALGNEPITDINDDAIEGSGAAYKLLRQVDQSRDVVLRRHGWHCALTYTTLTPEASDAGNWKYPYQYRLPGDCLRVWEIAGVQFAGTERECWAPRWQVATIDSDMGSIQVIRARESVAALPVAYVRRAAWGALDPMLVDAIGWELAGRCCYGVNGDRAASQTLMKAAENKILAAIGAEGTEEGGQEALAPSIPAQIRNMAR